MIALALSRGKTAYVDDVDADLANFKWSASKKKDSNVWYAHRGEGSRKNRKSLWLHRVVAERMGIAGMVDHRDRDGLNCRRENLRPASPTQNIANQDLRKNNTSGFKGVSRYKKTRWQAGITVQRRRIPLGYFADRVDAAKAYDRAAVKYFGDFAVLNFPAQENLPDQETTKR